MSISEVARRSVLQLILYLKFFREGREARQLNNAGNALVRRAAAVLLFACRSTWSPSAGSTRRGMQSRRATRRASGSTT